MSTSAAARTDANVSYTRANIDTDACTNDDSAGLPANARYLTIDALP